MYLLFHMKSILHGQSESECTGDRTVPAIFLPYSSFRFCLSLYWCGKSNVNRYDTKGKKNGEGKGKQAIQLLLLHWTLDAYNCTVKAVSVDWAILEDVSLVSIKEVKQTKKWSIIWSLMSPHMCKAPSVTQTELSLLSAFIKLLVSNFHFYIIARIVA